MATESDSIERIAADILIASIGQTSAGTASALVNKPEHITKAYKAVHEAVREAREKRQEG